MSGEQDEALEEIATLNSRVDVLDATVETLDQRVTDLDKRFESNRRDMANKLLRTHEIARKAVETGQNALTVAAGSLRVATHMLQQSENAFVKALQVVVGDASDGELVPAERDYDIPVDHDEPQE